MKQQPVSAILAIMLMLVSGLAYSNVVTTRHNLSVTGPGNIRASAEQQVCIFCHTPHNSEPNTPLWNRNTSLATYIPYSSSSANASIGQPTGSSILCLSCHDGTIALGKVLTRTSDIQMQGGVTTMPAGTTRLGTDLSDDHPVSFVYNSSLASQRNGELLQPSSLTGRVRLDNSGQMQCATCHDPHDNANGKFLVMPNIRGDLCETCHLKAGWSQTPHNNSTRGWDGSGPNPWPDSTLDTVRDNACQNCHKPHNAGSDERILKYATEETVCLVCHNGHVASTNIENEFNKTSIHPIANRTGVHSPTESATVNSRHVECYDCHDPHAANSGGGEPAGPIENVRGVDRNGNEIHPITAEYQLCFRCHADSTGKPPSATNRVYSETNVRLEFDTGKASFHPVVGQGQNLNVPSLLGGLSESSIIKCTSCHNNDSGPNANGSGPNGPHGSNYPNLLERQYLTANSTPESASAYALCYKCHDRNSIRANESFPLHSRHIENRRAPCNVCHDPHGSDFPRLINFDTTVVEPSNSGELRFYSTGENSGGCFLRCHGRNHDPCTYGTGGGGMGGMCGGGGGGGMGGM